LLDARICVVEAVHVIVFADGEVLSGLHVLFLKVRKLRFEKLLEAAQHFARHG
jgi:hypothetical protein